MAYQSYDGIHGDSRTQEKLLRLGLPPVLTGKTVLDLGCNEGFFCIEAKKRGAARVMGLDLNTKLIEAAQRRANEAQADVEFRLGDMAQLPTERFDYVLLLSALHYIEEPAKVLQSILSVLTPGGTLILEAGVAASRARLSIGRALRSIDERFFPSLDLLTQIWLKGFAVRQHGSSVAQAGDPIPRYVFHCTPAKTNVVFIVGNGGIGKSTLAAGFGGVPVISTDDLFYPSRTNPPKLEAAQKLYEESFQRTRSIWSTWEKIKDQPGVRDYFSAVICKAIRHCAGAGQVVVEGFVATELVPRIQEALGHDYQCWQTTRL